MEVLDEREEEPIEAETSKTQASPAVSIANVSFGYDEGEKIIKDLLLDIKQGETVALAGGSGSGKSTLFKLLMCFYKARSGKIKINGKDVCENIDATRREIAYVPQSNYLFAGTIRENISYGRQDANEKDIVSAAKSAYAHDFIMDMDNGYDTMVGERGESLSGGQRQRIAIARALLKNAPLLLLDEATSALDSESETKVQKAIDELLKGRTSIIAAHRLSTIRHADRIIVLGDGGIVEKGSHEELMGLDGRYAYYYNL
jgi:ABC-type multidrug transport system fused ATPase/permease subunit